MIQKVIKIGSSAGVTIPKSRLEELGIKVGDKIKLEIKSVGQDEDKEIRDWTQKFIDRYKPALKSLANK